MLPVSGYLSLSRFEGFLAIISSNTLSTLLSLSSPGILIQRRLAHFIHGSLLLLSFFSFGFLSAVLTG